jgi:hypothetical protein
MRHNEVLCAAAAVLLRVVARACDDFDCDDGLSGEINAK